MHALCVRAIVCPTKKKWHTVKGNPERNTGWGTGNGDGNEWWLDFWMKCDFVNFVFISSIVSVIICVCVFNSEAFPLNKHFSVSVIAFVCSLCRLCHEFCFIGSRLQTNPRLWVSRIVWFFVKNKPSNYDMHEQLLAFSLFVAFWNNSGCSPHTKKIIKYMKFLSRALSVHSTSIFGSWLR